MQQIPWQARSVESKDYWGLFHWVKGHGDLSMVALERRWLRKLRQITLIYAVPKEKISSKAVYLSCPIVIVINVPKSRSDLP